MSVIIERRSLLVGMFACAATKVAAETPIGADIPAFTMLDDSLQFAILTPDGKTDNLEAMDIEGEQGPASVELQEFPQPPRRPPSLTPQAAKSLRSKRSRRKNRQGASIPEETPRLSMPNILRGHAPDLMLSLRNSNTKESMTLNIGNYRSQKAEFNHFARDWRRNSEINISDALIEKFGRVANTLGVHSFNVFCAYRSRQTNEMLRKTRGGQASNSLHLVGKAFDLTADGVSPATLRHAALQTARNDGFGGVGYYPNSEIPFVHIDIGSLRSWPRNL